MRTLTVPAPGPWLDANGRTHWAVRARLTRSWRSAAGMHARAQTRRPLRTPVAITVTVHRATSRRADAANVGAPTGKAVIDGLRDAGWLPDDDDTHITATTIVAGAPGQPRLVLTITESED